MKTNFTLLVLALGLLLITFNGFSQIRQNTGNPQAGLELVYSDMDRTVIKLSVNQFTLDPVETIYGKEWKVLIQDATPILEKGAPDLPKMTTSILIPDRAKMEVKVLEGTYKEYTGHTIAPSKGNLYRDTDPSTVPFTYGEVYQKNAFYPGELAALRQPHIIRDFRGQTVIIYPIQYNPVTQTLRVYDELTLEISKIGENGENPLIRSKSVDRVVKEFGDIYSNHFINYSSAAGRYTPVDEHGNMLIISYGSFIPNIQPLVEWKKQTGMPVEVVDVATIGGSSQIKTYIANYYNTNGLTFVLLVGDAAQVPTSYASGDSDNDYTYVVGNDHYPDLFIGRFSAENTTHVDIQVTRTIEYEKNPDLNFDWFTRGIGIASDQGPGDDGEYDYEHIRNINTDLLNFTYTFCAELFDGSQGGNDAPGNPSPSQVAAEINTGASIINYTGHGSNTSWGTSGFSNSDVNNLVNEHMWPFIWSVACVNGNFVPTTCFAEAWLRSENNGNPAGAVATLMSTINQSWNPPMCGQDEMVDILVESYPNNIKRTFAALSMHGCMQMNDEYGSGGDEMTDTWTVFGDPSVMVRTAFPQTMTVSYNPNIFIGSNSFTLQSNAEGGVACLTENGQILATAFITGGSATLTFPALNQPTTLTLTITGFNFLPHIAPISVIPANIPYLMYESHDVNDPQGNNNGYLDYDETVFLSIALENLGGVDAEGVSVVIRTNDSYASISDSTETYGTIPANTIISMPDAFVISVANNVPDEHQIPIEVIATDSQNETWTLNFILEAYAPILHIAEMVIDDNQGGNGNGMLDPGESAIIKIKNQNQGHCPADNCVGTLFTDCHYLTLNNNIDSLGTMGLIGAKWAEFSVVVDPEAPNGVILADFDYELVSGGFDAQKSWRQKIGLLVEDFETGNFNKFEWAHAGNMPWTISSVYPYEGIYSAKSGSITHGETSELKITLEIMTADTIYFTRKVSSQANMDKLKFYIDNTMKGEWSGTSQGWIDHAFYVSTGYHTFRWVYQKDGQGSSGSDCAWLDYIILPPVMTLTCYAGPDAESCGTNEHQCHGEATDWVAVEWTTTGSGTFDDFTILNPIYTPSNEDVQNGSVILALAAINGEGSVIDDEMTLSFIELPDAPSTPSGPEYVDILVTPESEYTIQPVEFASVYEWLLEPAEAGTIEGMGLTGTVTWNVNYVGSATVSVKAINYCGESDYSPGLNVAVDNTVAVAEIPFGWGVEAYPNPSSGNLFIHVKGFDNHTVNMKLVSMIGQAFHQESITTQQGSMDMQLDLSALPNGIYFLILEGDNLMITRKILINK
ncbi:MAG: T9SS type A sorting domain-containing protein [Bacteroidetes bacterium]|nr:T9SS type A sorting domain-containing protein [Bacteroidota bacterium]